MTEQQPGAEPAQDLDAFGIGRLFWVMSEAIVGADVASGRIVLWNPAASRLFGYSTEEALAMPLAQLVPPGLQQLHLDGIDRYRRGGDPVLVGAPPVDVPAMTKAGTEIEVALTLTDVGTETDSNRRLVLALLRDVTAVRRAEADLHMAMAAMGDFVAAASHDLRSPLTAVLGFAEILRHGQGLSDTQRDEALDALTRGATSAMHLVDDLLTLSQLQAGALPPTIQETPVAPIALEAIASTGVPATCAIARSVSVLVDPHHLLRILTNFLINASRHGREPIEITATVEGVR